MNQKTVIFASVMLFMLAVGIIVANIALGQSKAPSGPCPLVITDIPTEEFQSTLDVWTSEGRVEWAPEGDGEYTVVVYRTNKCGPPPQEPLTTPK